MPTSTRRRAVSGRVSGRVQGVSFRATMQAQALRLGVAGWVRNLPDGAVAFYAHGSATAVDELLRWAGGGPPGARVDALEVQEAHAATGIDSHTGPSRPAFRILD